MTKHSEKRAWKPSQNHFIGWVLTMTGFLVFIGSIIPAMMLETAGSDDYVLFLLCITMFGGGAIMIIHGKRHLTRRAEDVLDKDKRPPVIFLRSFDDESDEFSLRGFFRAVNTSFTNRGMGLAISSWGPTFQSQLAMVMERIGPYIAVGRPGAKLPGTGAARLYIPDDQWQKRVTRLLSEAKLVIIRAGASEGLQWEIEHVMQLIAPTKLLFILPLTHKRYESFRNSISKVGIKLPVALPNSLLMTFDENWQSISLDTSGKLEHVLEPLFAANNIPPPHTNMWDAIRIFFR